MPELPEVETVRLFLKKNIIHEKILSIKIKNSKLRYPIVKEISHKLKNTIVTKILRRGKYLLILYSNEYAVLFHLGMTGFFRLNEYYEYRKHDHIIFNFINKKLIFNDVRKFGFIKLYKKKEIFQCSHIKNLGPDPLGSDFSSNYFKNYLGSKTTIKNLLMNQNFVAGLGNIYCSEILFKSKILPNRLVKTIKKNEIIKIIKEVKIILFNAIELGGTTIKNFVVSDQEVGYFKNKLMVYGREGLPCLRCKDRSLIKKLTQSGRSTFFCSKCQV